MFRITRAYLNTKEGFQASGWSRVKSVLTTKQSHARQISSTPVLQAAAGATGKKAKRGRILLPIVLIGAGVPIGATFLTEDMLQFIRNYSPEAVTVIERSNAAVASVQTLIKEQWASLQSTEKPSPVQVPDSSLKKMEERQQREEENRRRAEALQAEEEEAKRRAEVEHRERELAAQREAELKRVMEEASNRQEQLKLASEAAQKDNQTLTAILGHVMDDVSKSGSDAIAAHARATAAVREHTAALQNAIETTGEAEGSEGVWALVVQARQVADAAAQEAEALHLATLKNMERLKVLCLEGKDCEATRSNPTLKTAEKTSSQVSSQVEQAASQLSAAQHKFSLVHDFQDRIRVAKRQFVEEMESLDPELRLGKGWGGRLTDEELETLLLHAHTRIAQLNTQLAKLQALEENRIEAALTAQQALHDRETEQRIATEKRELHRQFEEEKRKWEAEAELETEEIVRHELARQTQAHLLNLEHNLNKQQEKLNKDFQLELTENIVRERNRLQLEIAGSVARLKGIEEAVQARADMERQGRKAQELWLACLSLSNSITLGSNDPQAEGGRKPLDKDLAAIREAGSDHQFVGAVLDAFSPESVSQGVWADYKLRERFNQVYRTCRRVALVDETGGSMWQYMLSYAQSLMVLRYRKVLDENSEISDDTSQVLLLDTARHYIKKGDLEMGLRFMNQLKGAARVAASDWLREARLTCQVRQATDALLAHASCAGLSALF